MESKGVILAKRSNGFLSVYCQKNIRINSAHPFAQITKCVIMVGRISVEGGPWDQNGSDPKARWLHGGTTEDVANAAGVPWRRQCSRFQPQVKRRGFNLIDRWATFHVGHSVCSWAPCFISTELVAVPEGSYNICVHLYLSFWFFSWVVITTKKSDIWFFTHSETTTVFVFFQGHPPSACCGTVATLPLRCGYAGFDYQSPISPLMLNPPPNADLHFVFWIQFLTVSSILNLRTRDQKKDSVLWKQVSVGMISCCIEAEKNY